MLRIWKPTFSQLLAPMQKCRNAILAQMVIKTTRSRWYAHAQSTVYSPFVTGYSAAIECLRDLTNVNANFHHFF